jgi:hypothetical protein
LSQRKRETLVRKVVLLCATDCGVRLTLEQMKERRKHRRAKGTADQEAVTRALAEIERKAGEARGKMIDRMRDSGNSERRRNEPGTDGNREPNPAPELFEDPSLASERDALLRHGSADSNRSPIVDSNEHDDG